MADYKIPKNTERHDSDSCVIIAAAAAATLMHGGDRKSENIKGPNGPLNGVSITEAARSSYERTRRRKSPAATRILDGTF